MTLALLAVVLTVLAVAPLSPALPHRWLVAVRRAHVLGGSADSSGPDATLPVFHRAVDAVRCRAASWRRRDTDADLIVFLDAMARSCRSGTSPRQAFDEGRRGLVGPLANDLDRVLLRTAAGEPLTAALGVWPVPPRSGAALTRAVLRIGLDAGGDLACAMEEVAATLRHRVGGRQETKALAAQARLSAMVVAVAPLVFTVLAGVTDPAVIGFLLGTPAGWACLVAGLGLDVVGALWMRRITASVLP